MENNTKKTGSEWSKILNVEILNPRGWMDKQHYMGGYITREEFCNRAVNSDIVKKPALSRREAAKHMQPKKKNENS